MFLVGDSEKAHCPRTGNGRKQVRTSTPDFRHQVQVSVKCTIVLAGLGEADLRSPEMEWNLGAGRRIKETTKVA